MNELTILIIGLMISVAFWLGEFNAFRQIESNCNDKIKQRRIGDFKKYRRSRLYLVLIIFALSVMLMKNYLSVLWA